MKDEERDLGPPAVELQELDQPATDSFLEALRRKVERRVVTGQVAAAWWYLPGLALLQFLEIVFSLISPSDRSKGDAS